MKTIQGDLLEGQWDCCFHVANVYKTMGSGVAYFLKKKWPEVYEADMVYDQEFDIPHHKLGTFSKAIIPDGRWVYNLYGQVGVGNDGSVLGRNCHYNHLYDAMYTACEEICKLLTGVVIGCPKFMGCGRAGGSWIIVEAMLKDLEERFPITFEIYEFGDEQFPQSTQPV
jgi:O-acetyl-ADP-ribose deacetylase (regulator of RNase III)